MLMSINSLKIEVTSVIRFEYCHLIIKKDKL
jgi:hypothetical protein